MTLSYRTGGCACLAAGLFALLGCAGRPLFQRGKPAVENISADIPGERFKALATIAGNDGRTDLRMSADVRLHLTQAGFTAVPRAGRWESEQTAVADICATRSGVDGVLVVTYRSLKLIDCATTKTAYEIIHDPEAGGPGIQGLTLRLVRYLRGETKAKS